MNRSTTRANTPFGDASRPPRVALAALGLGVVYLWWRSSTLGVGSLLIVSIPVLVIEAWSLLELAVLTLQTWRLPTPIRRAESGRAAEPVDLAILAAGADVEELERTLLACRSVRSRGQLVVIDDSRQYRHRSLAAEAGASYRIDRRAVEAPGLAAHRNTASDRYVWLTAGQLPMPDLIEATAPRFDREEVAVCQLAASLLNSDDLAHLGREHDDDTLVNQVLGPALSRWDAGLWLGSASVVRRQAIDDIGGFDHQVPIERLVARLHRAGWATAFERRRLVATTAPEAMDRYLAQRRQRAGAALSVALSSDGPLMPGGSMRLGQRLAHLGAAIRFGTGVRLLMMAVLLIAVLLSGRFPAEASLFSLVAFWALATVAGSVGRRSLARGSMGRGDWIHQGWRVLGAETAAVVDVVTGRVGPTVLDREPTTTATGLRALAHLPLLDAVILAVDLALLGRALTIADRDLLPAFPTGQRVVVIGFALVALVPIARVLQVAVVRQQRRTNYRIPAVLEATLDGSPAKTVDVTTEGAGIHLKFAPAIGTTTALEISLPGADGVVRRIVGRAVVRSARPDGDDRWRVGLELVQIAPAARQALISFCAQQPIPDDLDEAEVVAVDPATTAEERRRRSVGRITVTAALAGLATVIFGPGVASASTADPALVDQVCVVDVAELPVADVVVERLVDDGAQVLGATDLIGCLDIGPAQETTGFAVTHRGARHVLAPGDYRGSLAEVALVSWWVRVVDLDAEPVAGAEVRFFTDRWLRATGPLEPGDGHRFDGLPLDPAGQQVEVRLDGVRHVRAMEDRTDRSIVLSRLALADELGPETSPVIDRGRGWEAAVDGMNLVPGPLVVRLAGGEILRFDVPESHQLQLPSGLLVPVEVELPVEAVPGMESDVGPAEDPSETSTTTVPGDQATTSTIEGEDPAGESPTTSTSDPSAISTTTASGADVDPASTIEPSPTTATTAATGGEAGASEPASTTLPPGPPAETSETTEPSEASETIVEPAEGATSDQTATTVGAEP